jgi:hypothetical protein
MCSLPFGMTPLENYRATKGKSQHRLQPIQLDMELNRCSAKTFNLNSYLSIYISLNRPALILEKNLKDV